MCVVPLFTASIFTMSDSFGESVSVLAAIQAILHDYPFSASILRELLQNSDDAGATKQVVAVPLADARIKQSHRSSFLTWGMTLRYWHTMTPSFKKRIGRRSKVSVSRPREQTHREYTLFLQSVIINFFCSKIGKYGVGFRACYHVRRSVSLFATDIDVHIGHRWTPNPFWVVFRHS